jgi:hypothetical protein
VTTAARPARGKQPASDSLSLARVQLQTLPAISRYPEIIRIFLGLGNGGAKRDVRPKCAATAVVVVAVANGIPSSRCTSLSDADFGLRPTSAQGGVAAAVAKAAAAEGAAEGGDTAKLPWRRGWAEEVGVGLSHMQTRTSP